MVEARPCSVCGERFQPHPRAGDRQRTCSRRECQRERHRRNCESWHARNPGYDRERRLRDRLVRDDRPTTSIHALERDPLAQIRWDVVRDAVPTEWGAVLEEVLVQVVQWARDAVRAQRTGRTDPGGGSRTGGTRDAFATVGVPP